MKKFSDSSLKRVLSLLLAIVMMIGLVPTNALAEGSEDGSTNQRTSSRAVDAEGKPPVEWDKTHGKDRDDGSSYWSLPSGVSVVNAHNGPDPLNTFGFTYLGKYLDDQGRVVLKFDIGHRPTANSGVWSRYVMRFPKELYQAVDPEASYVLWKQTEVYKIDNFDRLYTTDVTDQQAFTYQFPFRNSGSQYQHREINVVLKKDVNWEKDFEGKSQVIQLRLYNGDNNNLKIFSTSAWGSNYKFTSFGYNTHTKTAVVGDLSKRPGDLMESTTISMAGIYNDVFHTADSTLQLDKENKKVRIIYNIAKTNTNAPVGTPNSEYKVLGEDLALRQSLDPEFVRFLDLTDKNAKIGTFRLYHETELPSKDGPLKAESIDIYARDLNGVKKTPQGEIALDENGNPIYTRKDKSVFIQFGTKDFVDKENPDSTDPNYIFTKITDGVNIYNPTNNGNGILGVFEYNIDPTLINATMIKNKEFSKNFMFDTRYLTSNNEGMRKYTGVVQKDIVYGPNTKNFYSIRTQDYTSLNTSVSGNNTAVDFVLNIGGANGIWKSWKREGAAWFDEGSKDYAISTYGKQFYMTDHPIRIGGTIKAGTPITVYIPESKSKNVRKVQFDLVTGNKKGTSPTALKDQKSLTGGNSVTLTKETKENGSDVFHDPMYIKNTVSTIGGSAIREQYTPIIDEIFTDSKDFTGIMRTEGGVLASLYKPEATETKEHFGENWLVSEADDKGNITNYERTDGKLKEGEKPESISPDKIQEERTVKGKNEKDQVVDKTFKGFRFTIKKLYSGGEDFAKSDNETLISGFKLIKDQPVMFNAFRHTSLQSAPVYEQVQAKVKFMTYPDQGAYMEKIVPLNKEYSIEPEKLNAQGLEEVTRLKTTGKPNPTYKPNGFKAKPGVDNIRVDENAKTVTVKRKSLTETNSFDTDKDVTYPNFLNHDGYAYGVNSSDQTIRDAAVKEFIKRIYPDPEFDSQLSSDPNNNKRADGKVVIGWTTKELKDNGTRSAIDQYYDLEKDKKVLSDIKQWKYVDEDKQTYIFNEYSPVDKNRTVYAVWGTPSLVLHANNTDLDKEVIVRIPYNKDDINTTNNIIDAMTSATKDGLKKSNVIKKLPQAPYSYKSKSLGEDYAPELDAFIKEGSTFVGWTMKRYSNDEKSEFVAGNNNDRIGEIQKGLTKDGKSLPVRTESSQYMSGKRDVYVPNGYNFAVSKGFDLLMKEGKDIHLFANYRPYFDVKVKPSYMNIDKTADKSHQYGKYVDNVDAKKKKALDIALLYRTAVTPYEKPTVLQSATYNPLTKKEIADSSPIIQHWDGTPNKILSWKVPGYDREGMRQSFVATVVPQGKTDIYHKFKKENPDTGKIYDWNSLGFTTFVKVAGDSAELEKGAPRNLHETVDRGDPYGVGLAKQQAFTVNTEGKIDAFTSATSRQAVVRKTPESAEEVKGYNIFLTNTPQAIPSPNFESVKDTDTTIDINFDKSLVNEKLTKLKLKVPTAVQDGVEKETNKPKYKSVLKDLEFTIAADGKTFTGPEGMTATLNENTGKLTIGNFTPTAGFDFGNLPAGENFRTIYGTYVNKDSAEGDTGKVVITQVLTSFPVKHMEQVLKRDGETARIEFTVPNEGPTDQVVPGTIYTAQKFDKDQNKWVDVGSLEIEGSNQRGSKKEMKLEGDLKDGDLIRIKSKEPGKLEAYSVGEKDGAYTPLVPDPNDTKNPVADKNRYLILDLKGPEAEGKATDERFRRYIDIDATLKEAPGKDVTIEVGFAGEQGDPGNSKFTGDKSDVIKFYNQVVHTEDTIHGVWITATDQFGNTNTTKLTYDQTYQLVVTTTGIRPRRNYLRLKSERANTSVKLTFYKKGKVVHEETVKINDANKFQKFTLDNYRMEKGTYVQLDGSCTEDDKLYTTNPWKEFIN
ncbi:hypothetical protein [Peptostreptococcus anaerobius]|uniref:hypothetical protein n=1 Tax=Peptostreptococcus anaerobius TaxID=1261 RepID=UPI001D05D942|nr:hypothetical protein [Peptostreptococcus anaerobius]MCB6983331.1 hypothetical protein [Peptostreptococcus anaerobius]MCQ5151188.1 hypothetical protein [Peptostreptococcus anaerobius]MDU1599370.1 hypothetical protein [Peptostreptococcus anaerobius]MDU1682946.1 hypothetical protein [Peptostreptococcus anaerobius]